MEEHNENYHVITYKKIAEMFDEYFTHNYFKTSNNEYRIRYEVRMSEIDFWINLHSINIQPYYDIEEKSFKSGLFYHLKKLGWRPTDIRGRWKKQIRL